MGLSRPMDAIWRRLEPGLYVNANAFSETVGLAVLEMACDLI